MHDVSKPGVSWRLCVSRGSRPATEFGVYATKRSMLAALRGEYRSGGIMVTRQGGVNTYTITVSD